MSYQSDKIANNQKMLEIANDDENNENGKNSPNMDEKLPSISKTKSSSSLSNSTRSTLQGLSMDQTTPKSPYNLLTHQIRKMVPQETACKLGCSGKKCKYDNPDSWGKEDMVLNGIYSHWITEDILAMARPSTKVIHEYKIIEQMKELGIKSIFNLQIINEHQFCGHGLEKSGFSYDPLHFTENKIYYYNYAIEDYSVVNTDNMIDMVKVLSFALQYGKAAIHCHAGLGRTGLFIACYLIYKFRLTANQAINAIRDKRQKSVQMNDQIEAIQRFEARLNPLRIVFTSGDEALSSFSLNEFIYRQKFFLHGYEERKLRYIPKIIFVCFERLTQLFSNVGKQSSRDSGSITKKHFGSNYMNFSDENFKMRNKPNSQLLAVIDALCKYEFEKETLDQMEVYQRSINQNDEVIDDLKEEDNADLLVALAWSWLDHLKVPVLREQEIISLINESKKDNHSIKWEILDRCTYETINFMLNIYRELFKNTTAKHDQLLSILISVITQTSVEKSLIFATKSESESTLSIFNNHKLLKSTHRAFLLNALNTLLENPLRNSYSTFDAM